jgi:hypothetical protein
MKFSASYGLTVKLITVMVLLLFAVVIAIQFFPAGAAGGIFTFIIPVIFIAGLIITLGLSVTGYEITNDELHINRPFANIIIPKEDIYTVEAIDRNVLRWTVRTFGSGGLFGFYGKFYNKQLGRMTWYITRKDKAVLITTRSDKKILVSPDDREKFIEELKR